MRGMNQNYEERKTVCVCECVLAHVYMCACVHTCSYVCVCGHMCAHACVRRGGCLQRTEGNEVGGGLRAALLAPSLR